MIDQRFAPYAAALLHISLGVMWISHALLKPLVFGMCGFQGFLASQGMPTFLAWPVMIMELVGGILILLGLRGRIVSLVLLPIMAGATMAHAGNGWLFTNANGGWEYPVFLMAASVVQALLGDGAFALKNASSVDRAQLKTA